MSLSVIWPTAACSTRTFTSSCASFSTVAWIASALPCTSALISTATSFCTPAWMRASISSSVPRAPAVTPAALSRSLRVRNSAISRARLSFSTATNGSPADGTPARPRISTGERRPRLGDRTGLVVQHGAHPAPLGAGDHDVALPQRALLHQHRRHRAAAAVQPAFDHGAFGGAFRIGLQVEDFRLQRDRLGQLVEAGLLGRGNLHVLRLAAHLLDHDLVAEQFLADAPGIGVLLVHLVDGDDQRRAGRLGVADRLDGLRHHAVIRRHHQHHDVGDGGAAGAHGGERLVARGVDEGDLLARRASAPGRRRYAG